MNTQDGLVKKWGLWKRRADAHDQAHLITVNESSEALAFVSQTLISARYINKEWKKKGNKICSH